jgi:hypothetical protein
MYATRAPSGDQTGSNSLTRSRSVLTAPAPSAPPEGDSPREPSFASGEVSADSFVPSAFIIKMRVRPSRSLKKAILFPSGDQRGLQSSRWNAVSRCCPVPSARIR